MDRLQCGFVADTVFGPSVTPCRREFDFTLLFEEAILVTLPACVFILLGTALVLFLRPAPTRVRHGRLYSLKLFSTTALAVVQLAVLALQVRLTDKTRVSIASAAVSLVATVFIPLVSHVEHLKSVRPSSLLVVFLSLTSLFEATRVRTHWLSENVSLAVALSVALGIRLVALYLEAQSKSGLLLARDEKIADEVLAGPISRTVFHWLNGLMTSGYRKLLGHNDFGPVDDRLLSGRLRPRFQNISDRYRGGNAGLSGQQPVKSGNGLILLTLASLKWTLAGPIIARLAVTAFTFTQPFLVNSALSYLEAGYDVPPSHGYGLIGAAFLCYVGIAAATGWYWHQAYRIAVMVRGGLSVAIYEKLLRLPEGDKVESHATTLMVGDLQRIMNAFGRVHEIWAGIIETGLATWLLYRQLGPSCFVMLGVAAVSGVGSSQIVKKTGVSQQKWLAATQKRLKRTKQMLDSIKAIKMTSQDSAAYETLDELRKTEIAKSSSFRWIIVFSCFLSYTTLTLSPPLVLGVYVGTSGSDSFSVSKVFTSLVIIALLSSPLVQLFQVLPGLGAAYGCFQRLHEFLLLEEKTDYRAALVSETDGSSDPVLSLRDVSLGWKQDDAPILTNLNLDVKKGSKIAIIGSVGTGKTLLLKGLIGEAHKTHGQIALAPSTTVAYCSQNPWLENVSAQQNLTQYGNELKDSEFQRQLAADCMLDDIMQLPTFTSVSIGSGGVTLSGGQRQRLALARALSTKSDILILDDVFSALDRRTRWHVATTLMKRSATTAGRTVIYTTHDERIARLADEVYRIDESGHLCRVHDLPSVAIDEEKHSAEVESQDSNEAGDASSADEKPTETQAKAQAVQEDVAGQEAKDMLGDRTVYRTYFTSVGWFHSTIFFIGAMSWAFTFKFSDVWVRWWAESSAEGDTRLGYWLGIYAALGILALTVLCAWLYHQEFHLIPRSGKKLHSHLANTVLKAQFPVISQIDTGTSLNRFSQDLMFVDMQLPQDLFNTSSEFFTALIQIVLISTASLPALCAIPVLLGLLYVLQHFYLRTSKQLRLHELETKAGMLTKIAEAGSDAGLSTIRAHGWSDINMARFLDKLDRSQEPLYLLYAVQRWLQLVLNLIVAGLVVLVLGASIALKRSHKVSLGAVGVAFLNAVTLGEVMTYFIVAWTGLETSMGAIARIALFQRQTQAEEHSASTQALTGPGAGAVRFENVWATYDATTTSTSDSKDTRWSLRGVTLNINPGERVAICGKTGSGKSTLHLALLRMVNIPVGSVFIDGNDHANMSFSQLRKGFYVISQDKLEGFDNLRQELDPSGFFSDERLEAVLRECGVWDMVLNTPGGLQANRGDCKFSAGEEQLLSVARVLLDVERRGGEPGGAGGVVLLDEATSSVDKDTEEKMEILIRTRLGGRTLIAINHRLEAVLDYDKVVVLEGGRLVDVGTPAELVQRSELFAGLKMRGAA
ncbi:canalicular multispecific organic anion transporter 1 [Coniochaeta sp. 2T2.1]|nr:canalicular multispecific organic anion transporter 1 [Coniochaeta sp. 2T2.1]